jgi:hypothetical protein
MERDLSLTSSHISVAVLLVGSMAAITGSAAADSRATIPDLSGQWGHSNLNLEQPATGPKIMTNTLFKKDGTIDDDAGRLADYKSPLLTPLASGILKGHGEYSMTGASIPDPHNQCWPEPPPFTMSIQIELLVVQRPGEVVLIYSNDQKVRHIPLNVAHSHPLVPTYAGDSVGHFEGDTLVVDTIGIRPTKWPVVDRYGTPHSEALHTVERYRLIDGKAAEEAMAAHRRLYTKAPMPKFDAYGGAFDPDLSHKGLQVVVTVEDPKMFTQPWTAVVTYRPETNWPEIVCADPPSLANTTLLDVGAGPREIPVAQKADF